MPSTLSMLHAVIGFSFLATLLMLPIAIGFILIVPLCKAARIVAEGRKARQAINQYFSFNQMRNEVDALKSEVGTLKSQVMAMKRFAEMDHVALAPIPATHGYLADETCLLNRLHESLTSHRRIENDTSMTCDDDQNETVEAYLASQLAEALSGQAEEQSGALTSPT